MRQIHETSAGRQPAANSRLGRKCAIPGLVFRVVLFVLLTRCAAFAGNPDSSIFPLRPWNGPRGRHFLTERGLVFLPMSAFRAPLCPSIELQCWPRVTRRLARRCELESHFIGAAVGNRKKLSHPRSGDRRLRPFAESVRSRLLRLLRFRCRSLVDQTQLAPRLERRQRQVHGQSGWPSVSRIDVPRFRARLGLGLLGRSGLHLPRQPLLGDRWGNHAALRNDQINTGIGGSFLGEALFRMSSLWLERGRGSRFWREIVAAVISPPVGFNRLAFGDRFDGIFLQATTPILRPAARLASCPRRKTGRDSPSKRIKRHEGIVDFALDYGLPGKPGYTYERPFDYFSFQ